MTTFTSTELTNKNELNQRISILHSVFLFNKGSEVFNGESYSSKDNTVVLNRIYINLYSIKYEKVDLIVFRENYNNFKIKSITGSIIQNFNGSSHKHELYSKEFVLYTYLLNELFRYYFIIDKEPNDYVVKINNFLVSELSHIKMNPYYFFVKDYVSAVFDNNEYRDGKIKPISVDVAVGYIDLFLKNIDEEIKTQLKNEPPFKDVAINNKYLPKFYLSQRFYLMEKFGLIDKINGIPFDKDKDKYEFFAILLDTDKSSARHLLNASYNTFVPLRKKEIRSYLKLKGLE